MDLKTCRKTTNILYLLCLALFICALMVGNRSIQMGILGGAMAMALMITILRVKFWRCPKCKHMLPKGRKIRCEECGWEFGE